MKLRRYVRYGLKQTIVPNKMGRLVVIFLIEFGSLFGINLTDHLKLFFDKNFSSKIESGEKSDITVNGNWY